MRAKISNRPVQYETGLFREPGQFGALPNSEINISPVEGTTEGVFIGDLNDTLHVDSLEWRWTPD